MKTALVFVLAIGLVLVSPFSSATAYGFFMEGSQLNTDQLLSIAEKQHEIAKLLIKEGRYDRVLPEMRKIFDLNLQGEYEQLVAKSSSFIAYLLAEKNQYTLGHELLDETLAKTRQCENSASLLKVKAYLYKAEGKTAKAINTLEHSVDIERQCPQQ